MKRYERKRIEADLQTDQLLTSREGQSQYWQMLSDACRSDPKTPLLELALALPGDVIECGVYRGWSTMKMARLVAEHAPQKNLYACDSFQGFPQEQLGRVDVGWLRRLSKIRRKFRTCADTPQRLERLFSTYQVRGQVVKGYFDKTLPRFENTSFCFIHLDCDIYSSYKECLRRLYKNLVPGGVVVFDEYRSPKWPGAKKAVDEFFASTGEFPTRSKGIWHVRKTGDAPMRRCA